MSEKVFEVVLKAKKLNSRKGFMNVLNEAFYFPSYFGENLDATWDCMTDLSWLEASAYSIRLMGYKGVEKDIKFDFVSFLKEVQAYWHSEAVAFELELC